MHLFKTVIFGYCLAIYLLSVCSTYSMRNMFLKILIRLRLLDFNLTKYVHCKTQNSFQFIIIKLHILQSNINIFKDNMQYIFELNLLTPHDLQFTSFIIDKFPLSIHIIYFLLLIFLHYSRVIPNRSTQIYTHLIKLGFMFYLQMANPSSFRTIWKVCHVLTIFPHNDTDGIQMRYVHLLQYARSVKVFLAFHCFSVRKAYRASTFQCIYHYML